MLVSERHRFLFVHVPKAAGTSIAMALSPYGDSGDLLKKGTKHEDLRSFFQRHADRDFSSYFKFAFVRNPWDRTVSYFHYLKSRSDHVTHMGHIADFRHFVQEIDKEAEWLRSRHAIRPQVDFVTGPDGELLVDLVGRYENLADDFRRVCARVGADVELPRLNSSPHGAYQQYYDAHSRMVIERRYRKDIENFGYVFG